MGYLRFAFENRLFLLAGILLTFTSSYGQTFFISLYAGEIRAEFGLSHGAWGLIYTMGTTASAVVMLAASILTDRFRIRALAMGVMALLALACLAMAAVPNALVLVLVIFALRFAGQGMMSQLAIVAMARWFVATRGKALSIAAMGFALGQALLPIVFVAALPLTGWRWQWVIAAGLVVVAMPVILALLQAERSPRALAEEKSSLGMQSRHWTRGEMLRHPLFWVLVPMLLGPPAWGTSLFFHQVHLTEVKGWDLVDYVALMPIYTAVSVAATFASGWAIDRFGSGALLRLYLMPFVLGFVVIALTPSLLGACLGLMIFGIGQGLQSTVIGAFWAEYYGTRYVGGIKGISMAVMVLGSAIGPGVSGLVIDLGVDFPTQMLGYAGYFLAAGLLASVGLSTLTGRSAAPA